MLSNPIEGTITGYQILLIKIFDGKLEKLNNHDVKALNVDELVNVSTTKRAGGDSFEEDDDEDDDEEEDLEGSNERPTLHKLTEMVEKSLQAPSQANKNLTAIKKIVQKTKLAKGNNFASDGSDKLVS